MKYTIGIDVGGTNTDGVLYDTQQKTIEKSIKIPTNHNNYTECIEKALRELTDGAGAGSIISFNVSTTLSTNMLLEKKGAPVNLILIGFEDFPHIRNEILNIVSPSSLLDTCGGHTRWGMERATLDVAALDNYANTHKGELFTVSALFSPRNPEHEQTAARIIKESGCTGITCGHEIARSKLNSVKRTVTAFLNTSLIPVTGQLIAGVMKSANAAGIKCPIMFLRSDSSLVSDEWCARFPIETIFSGPAASMRGGAILGGVENDDAVIVDIGGTSTDIGVIHGGNAVYSHDGAVIGEYSTMIPSLRIRSVALGGDSAVKVLPGGGIQIGPERVPPFFCRAQNSGYTPSDALCTLGVYKHEGAQVSAEASSRYGALLNLKPEEFAARVRCKVSSRLEHLINSVNKKVGTKIICVGAPAASLISEGTRYTVPSSAPVASALGAASSSLSLCCTAAVLHNFSDETFSAFLPSMMIKSENLAEISDKARDKLIDYVKEQAKLMGFEGVSIHISCEEEYIGHMHTPSTLSAIYMTAQAIVHNAHK